MRYSTNNTTNNILIQNLVLMVVGFQIYWNTSENTYFEVFTKQKHI